MKWNWQQPDWGTFDYDIERAQELDALFYKESGVLLGAMQHFEGDEREQLTIELLGNEACKTSEIEGEYLNRESVQSSLRRSFGLETDDRRVGAAESGIAEMMVDLYQNYDTRLSDAEMFHWHEMLMRGRRDLKWYGGYRAGDDPMCVISGPLHDPVIHFEAPHSSTVNDEMARFITWYNATGPGEKEALPVLVRAGIAHLYFISIHPFEDGNGRIARALCEKAMAQALGEPSLISLSYTIERNKKKYYAMLEESNKSNEVSTWLEYFGKTTLTSIKTTQQCVKFIIEKARMYDRVSGKLNERQEKALDRIFKEGVDGFTGGLSARNYISITKTTRATATRDLIELVNLDVLKKTGALKSTRYYLNIDLD